MTDLLLSTPEEFRAVVSSHTFRNLDTVRGYLVDSQNTFLRQRLGQPLIKAMLQQYTDLKPIVPDPSEDDNDNYDDIESQPWVKLIQLAQRCIAYDALYRSAGIRRVSDNDMGINVAESDNFAAVDKDRFAEYKIDLYRGAHSASDMLLTQLQDWEREAAAASQSNEGSNASQSNEDSNASQSNEESVEGNVDTAPVPRQFAEAPAPDADGDPSPTDAPSPSPSASEAYDAEAQAAIATIIDLWRQSPTYPLTDGLLFTTATEFNTYVNIQQSLDKFVELLPDIRYCQELHLEAEIGTDLLAYLQRGHRADTLNATEQKAYQMLQRTLSLYVEARNAMFKRPDARDEAAGHMRLTRNFIVTRQLQFDRRVMSTSPLFAPHLWPRFDAEGHPLAPDGTPLTDADGNPLTPVFDPDGHPVYPALDECGRPICHHHHGPHPAAPSSHFDAHHMGHPSCPDHHHPHMYGSTEHDHTHISTPSHLHPHHPHGPHDLPGFCESSLI